MAPFISDLANSTAREQLLASLLPRIVVPYPSEQTLREQLLAWLPPTNCGTVPQ